MQEKEEDKYRDRAAERRHGTTQEYNLSEEAAKSLTVEESKYLGGDMEHTHLVKGLDFALLAKMRSELEEKEAAKGEDLIDNAREEAAQIQGTVSTRTTLGLAVRKLCLNDQNSGARPKLELFLPGRTTFVFDLDDDFGEDIPRQVSRSVEDVRNRVKDKRTAVIGKQVMESVQTIMSYIRQGSRPVKHKVKRKEKETPEKAPAAAPPPAFVPDDDIFDDAGTYDLTMRAAEQVKEKGKETRRPASPPPPGMPPPSMPPPPQ